MQVRKFGTVAQAHAYLPVQVNARESVIIMKSFIVLQRVQEVTCTTTGMFQALFRIRLILTCVCVDGMSYS